MCKVLEGLLVFTGFFCIGIVLFQFLLAPIFRTAYQRGYEQADKDCNKFVISTPVSNINDDLSVNWSNIKPNMNCELVCNLSANVS